jgi:hypothetical protein
MRLGWRTAAALGALLGALDGAPARGDEADAARRAAAAELSALAPRIEALKREGAGQPASPELLRLLARAQELAAILDRGAAAPAPAPPGPDAQELRERADAARDGADRLAAELAEIERRLAQARRRAELQRRLDAVGAASDLFAQGVPRRPAPPSAAPPAGGPAGGAVAPPAGPAAGPAPPAGPSAGEPPQPAVSAEPRAATTPPGLAGAPPPADASPAELRRRRAEVAARMSELRARAEALEAEARAAESAR